MTQSEQPIFCSFPDTPHRHERCRPAGEVSEANAGVRCNGCHQPMNGPGMRTEEFGGVMHGRCYDSLHRHSSTIRSAATRAAVARMRELAEKWREDRRTYPYNEHGIVASVAIRACVIELATLADELDHP